MSNANLPPFPDFGKLVPGFDFLQNLARQATGGAAQSLPQLPNLGNWIAPTINLEELDKRVQELKAVQFWLDQNAAALKATIQALELQKMTLATLKGMNFNMGDVANAFKLKPGDAPAADMPRPVDKPKGFAGLEVPPSIFQASQEKRDTAAEPVARPSVLDKADKADADAPSAAVPGMADPMQWWGALTQQFQAIATEAMKEVAKTSALDASKSVAVGMAKEAVKTATDMATGLAKGMTETATQTLAGGTRAAMKNALGAGWPKPAGAKAPAAAPRKTAARPAAKAAAKTTAKSAAQTVAKAKAPAAARKKAGVAARKTTR